ncbi:uncharacterized protein METZ01_LOCUS425237 [marine metagenome]|uniref:Dephospho-CoA kinase n=1 Tax=marine metagenome TaxID=408172 RepID=A0A382XN28_9ZZZZ
MKRIGLTGGIGAGKTCVSKVFQKLGISIFNADKIAKEYMQSSDELKEAIKELFGNNVFKKGILQSKILAEIVFNDYEKLIQLNRLVHPFVLEIFDKWQKKQNAPFVLKEAAILFESGAYKKLDAVICVSAPMRVKIERVMKRDNCTKKEVLKRMNNQMPENEKEKLSDFVILNDGKERLLPQILDIFDKINNLQESIH